MDSNISKIVVELYLNNNFSEANRLLESLIAHKLLIQLERRKEQMAICSEGNIKTINKKKKNKLMVRAGRTTNGLSAKHSGRTLFRTLTPNNLKYILATEQFENLDEEKSAHYNDIHSLLNFNGFSITNKKGSHIKYTHKNTGISIPISHHNNIVSAGVVRKAKNAIKEVAKKSSVSEQYRPAGFHKKYTETLKQHLRITHPIQKEKRNRSQYKNLQNKLDRKPQ